MGLFHKGVLHAFLNLRAFSHISHKNLVQKGTQIMTGMPSSCLAAVYLEIATSTGEVTLMPSSHSGLSLKAVLSFLYFLDLQNYTDKKQM